MKELINQQVKVQLEKVSKKFGGVIALDNVDFELRTNEVHGLVGKNGAGKTTLINILSGRLQPDDGRILFGNQVIKHMDPHVAKERGIAVCSQEPEVVSQLTVAENFFLGKWAITHGRIDWTKLFFEVEKMLQELHFDVNPRDKIIDLSIGQRELVSIGKAFFIGNPQVIVLDEVTASLISAEEEKLFKMIRTQINQANGRSIIFISHRLEEVFQICNRVTVFRDGRKVGTYNVDSLDVENLSSLIVGSEVKYFDSKSFYYTEKPAGKELLSVEHLSNKFLQDISFKLYEGEIVGIVGLMGSGRTNLFKTLVGEIPMESGIVRVAGECVNIRTPEEALKWGICLLHENREAESIISNRSVKENITLSSIKKFLRRITHFISHKREKLEVRKIIEKYAIVTPSIDQQVQFLSGGNRQKAVIARILLANPKIYLLDDLVKGIDVESKFTILKFLLKELPPGIGVLTSSSEEEFLFSICDRILVLFEGKIAAELRREEFIKDKKKLYRAIEGETKNECAE